MKRNELEAKADAVDAELRDAEKTLGIWDIEGQPHDELWTALEKKIDRLTKEYLELEEELNDMAEEE